MGGSDAISPQGLGVSASDVDAVFDRCFQAHYADLLRFAARRVRDAAEAEDVLAETFAVAWRRRDSIPDPALPWLFGVARRVLANRRRTERRADQLAARLASEPPPAVADPSELVACRAAVLAAFAELSETDREVLRVVAWDGLDPAEAARVLGCSRAALKVRLHRARRKLERKLQAEKGVSSDQSHPNPRPQESR